MISKALSKDLALRDSANNLFTKLNKTKNKEIIIDFKNVKSITRSFAHQYQENKTLSKKKIYEENVPTNVSKMFKIITNTNTERAPLINLCTAQTMTI
jgi:hypothetical protein